MNIAVAISHLLIVFNCSTNFIIYCSKDIKFRGMICKVITKMFVLNNLNMVTPSNSSVPLLNLEASKKHKVVKIQRDFSFDHESSIL